MRKYFLFILVIVLAFTSCAIEPQKTVFEDDYSFIIPKKIENISATKNQKEQITVTFDNHKIGDEYNYEYQIHLKDSESGKVETIPVAYTKGDEVVSVTLDKLPSDKVYFIYANAIISYEDSDGYTKSFTGPKSNFIEGATLPSLDIQAIMLKGFFKFNFDTYSLTSKINEGETFYNFSIELQKKVNGTVVSTNWIYTQNDFLDYFEDSSKASEVTLEYSIILKDADGNVLSIGVLDPFTTEKSIAPLKVQNLKATDDKANEIEITFNFDRADKIMPPLAYRVDLTRKDLNTSNEETILSFEDEIGEYISVIKDDNNLSLYSFKYSDTTAERNTEYTYNVKTYYYNGNVDIYIASDEIVESNNANMIYLPINLDLVDQTQDDGSTLAINNINKVVNLSWEFIPGKELPDNASIVITRLDTMADITASTTLNKTIDDILYTDELDVDNIVISDGFESSSHDFVYKLKVVVDDEIVGEELSFSSSVAYEPELALKKDPLINNLTSNDKLFENVKIDFVISSEQITKDYINVYRANNLSDITDQTPIHEVTLDFKGSDVSFIDTVESGQLYSYVIRVSNPDTVGLTNLENITVLSLENLSALDNPSNPTATMGEYNDKIVFTAEVDSLVSKYKTKLSVKLGDISEDIIVPTSIVGNIITFEYEPEENDHGKVFDFKLVLTDKNDTIKESGIVHGASLGVYSLNEKSQEHRESFKISWSPVPGAQRYNLKLFFGETQLGSTEVITAPAADNTWSWTLIPSNPLFDASVTNPYPLSEKYRVEIIPARGPFGIEEIKSLKSKTLEASWILPPKNISAEKYQNEDSITISWTPPAATSGISDYEVYYKISGIDDNPWIRYNPSNDIKNVFKISELPEDQQENIDKYSAIDFTVASIKDGVTSIVQRDFYDESNIGHFNVAPKITDAIYKVGEFLDLSFNSLSYINDYIITSSKGDEIIIAESGQEFYTQQIDTSAYDIVSYTIKARGDGFETVESSPYHIGNDISDFIFNIVNQEIKTHLTAANTDFDGDWWPGETPNRYSSNGISIKSSENATQSKGYLKFENYKISINGLNLMLSSDELELVAKNEGLAGYLGKDPLEVIGTGNIHVTVEKNNVFGQLKREIEYRITSSLNVINNNGTVDIALFDREINGDIINEEKVTKNNVGGLVF